MGKSYRRKSLKKNKSVKKCKRGGGLFGPDPQTSDIKYPLVTDNAQKSDDKGLAAPPSANSTGANEQPKQTWFQFFGFTSKSDNTTGNASTTGGKRHRKSRRRTCKK